MPAVSKKALIFAAIAAAVIAIGVVLWPRLFPSGPGAGFVSGNGRIEATEIDIAAKLAGRIQQVLVKEGDFVQVGQPLVRMEISVLEAQRDEANAQLRRAINAIASAEAQVAVSTSNQAAAVAIVAQRESELDAARRRFSRSETLSAGGAASMQEMDDDRARLTGAHATVNAAKAQVKAADAAVIAAKTQVVSAHSAVEAAKATVAKIEADIADSVLKSPRTGRVQYLIAQEGEVVGAGGKVINLVDLADVYMTFFLPETVAGRVHLGSDVRIVLDAAPEFVVPAKVSFVASTAQFTPKTVETASERQKLMFRVKARIDPDLLRKHLEVVKTGLPGMAWLKLDNSKPWPDELTLRAPQ